jgi:opacity protein-like surface antigen
MRKSYLILVALSVLMISGVRAQEVAIGVKGGLTVPNITPGGTKTPLSEGYKSRLAWGTGAFVEYSLCERIALQIGLEYSQQGGQKNGMQALPAAETLAGVMTGLSSNPQVPAQLVPVLTAAMPTDKYLYADFESTAKFNYLMLPVQAKVGWNLSKTSPVRIYISAGVFGSCLLSAERVSKGNSPFSLERSGNYVGLGSYFGNVIDAAMPGSGAMVQGIFDSQVKLTDNTQDITDEIKSFNFGFIGALGLSYRLCERHTVFIEGGGNYGLVKIQKNADNGQNRIGCGSVMLGYSFTL